MILIAMGSNLSGPWGTPRETLNRAIAEMDVLNIRVQTISTFLETPPFGVADQPGFINAVVRVVTKLAPEVLLKTLHEIEAQAGRVRAERWGPRTLDLDIIDYNGLIQSPTITQVKPLTLPHPGIEERSFVLAPIAEIAPRWKHPVSRKPAALILRQLLGLNAN